MERKIGEIFEYNGEWYQCVEGTGCYQCAFNRDENTCIADNPHCICRSDKKDVIFKKLEKWGEPYPNADKLYQLYRLPMNIEKLPPHTKGINLVRFDIVEIKVKQINEDMEEKKLNLKPFDIQKAREGKTVCTRDGRKARIICFDRKLYHDGYNYPIVAMVNDNDNELVHAYTQDGLLVGNAECELDLMMLPEKKEGWINVYKVGDSTYVTDENIYETKEEAIYAGKENTTYVASSVTEWEE